MLKNTIKKILGIPVFSNVTVGMHNETTRVQWLESTLRKLPKGSRLLDAGAGEQPFKKFCTHLDYVSQDFAQYNPQELDKGLQKGKWDYGKLDIVSDIASIPEPDASFDAVMCTEVFEHVINPRDAVKEFSRLLKKDGLLILSAPFCSLTHFAPYHYYTGFSRFFYEKELTANGFEIREITSNGSYFEYLAQEIRRLPSIAEKYSSQVISESDQKSIYRSLMILDRCSRFDKGSAELLCFGYQIVAKKK